jgi:hypothetical protein
VFEVLRGVSVCSGGCRSGSEWKHARVVGRKEILGLGLVEVRVRSGLDQVKWVYAARYRVVTGTIVMGSEQVGSEVLQVV